ncbi:MAG: amino acid-binding protein [Candidatus Omnitrophica bacterium]|nr:amino acid-binding protein [Candidatus Omnitrophota bacterium]
MSRRWILTALGRDRPGIVARVTKILYALGCNLEDSAMTRLAGEFAIMVVFSARPAVTQVRLEQACRPLREAGLATHLKALTAAESVGHARRSPCLITVYGADHPGIVYRVSALLAGLKVNIADVSTHRAAAAKKPLYLMMLEVELPPGLAVTRLERRLKQLARRLGVAVNLRATDTQVL